MRASTHDRIGATGARGSTLRSRRTRLCTLAAGGLAAALAIGADQCTVDPGLAHPILFVTQVPVPADFATIGSVFSNHRADLQSVARGGDLWIRYPDGTLRNLTHEAGYGDEGQQGANAIAVRDPDVRWDATRAVFSMVVGAPTQQYQVQSYRWQLYEVSGLGQGESAVITKLPGQPLDANNVEPSYLSDGTIVFVSDRAFRGQAHLYPMHDEYESTASNNGLYRLDPVAETFEHLEHAPSGAFHPRVDSFGRVVFTRWDHLQRDQQADAGAPSSNPYGTFDFADETAGAVTTTHRVEVFPEPRPSRADLLAGTNLEGHTINHFFPWTIRQDGTGEETLNHVGRHELHAYFNRSLNDDPKLVEFIAGAIQRTNPVSIENTLQIREDPSSPGRYVAVESPEFSTHASGQLIAISAPPGLSADQLVVEEITHPATASYVGDGETAPPEHSGHYRDPLPLADGRLVAAHTSETRAAGNEGSRAHPVPRYHFRLRLVGTNSGAFAEAGMALTAGLEASVSWWDPDVLVSYDGPLWELSPVEVRPRAVPPAPGTSLDGPETSIFSDLGISVESFRQFLRAQNLAVLVVRNATTRDAADRQQPFNLRVPGGTQTVSGSGAVYDVAHLELFQADHVRGIGGIATPRDGRRVLARVLHDPAALAAQVPNPSGPAGSVAVAADGSVAAFVPAGRALAWQLTDPSHVAVVRERYWITFRPGEIRACDGCHGVNATNQAGAGPATNAPQALATLLDHWRISQGPAPR